MLNHDSLLGALGIEKVWADQQYAPEPDGALLRDFYHNRLPDEKMQQVAHLICAYRNWHDAFYRKTVPQQGAREGD